MAEAYSPSNTNQSAKSNVGVNLDIATRASIVTAACIALYNTKRTAEMNAWRMSAADWDMPTLLLEASRLGVKFLTGGKVFTLPMNIPHR